MLRRRPIEINVNHERWLVSYADFVTLLFAFFVVMYSISQVNESKYKVLSNTLTEIFDNPELSLKPIQVGDPVRSNETQVIDNGTHANADTVNQNKTVTASDGLFQKTADLPQLADQFSEQFADLVDDQTVQVSSNEFWLQISFNNSILFPLGSVKPTLQARSVLGDVANLLKGFSNPIQVEGFTDNMAINSNQFPSNWELSSARAAAVVKLLANNSIKPERLSAVGYGEFQPIAENNSAAGRAQNRRVVLMMAREKIKRPQMQVSNPGAIAQRLQTPVVDATQVNPQPNVGPAALSAPTGEAIDAKIEQLLNSNSNLGLDIILQAEGGERQNDGTSNNRSIKPVELNNGELLFSSDPELPRKKR